MLLFQVAVKRRLARDVGRHVDGVGGRRFYRGSVALVYAHKLDDRSLVGRGIWETQNAELLRRAVGLDAQNDVKIALAGAVGVHSVGCLRSLEDDRLVAVRVGSSRSRRRLGDANERESRRYKRQNRPCGMHMGIVIRDAD